MFRGMKMKNFKFKSGFSSLLAIGAWVLPSAALADTTFVANVASATQNLQASQCTNKPTNCPEEKARGQRPTPPNGDGDSGTSYKACQQEAKQKAEQCTNEKVKKTAEQIFALTKQYQSVQMAGSAQIGVETTGIASKQDDYQDSLGKASQTVAKTKDMNSKIAQQVLQVASQGKEQVSQDEINTQQREMVDGQKPKTILDQIIKLASAQMAKDAKEAQDGVKNAQQAFNALKSLMNAAGKGGGAKGAGASGASRPPPPPTTFGLDAAKSVNLGAASKIGSLTDKTSSTTGSTSGFASSGSSSAPGRGSAAAGGRRGGAGGADGSGSSVSAAGGGGGGVGGTSASRGGGGGIASRQEAGKNVAAAGFSDGFGGTRTAMLGVKSNSNFMKDLMQKPAVGAAPLPEAVGENLAEEGDRGLASVEDGVNGENVNLFDVTRKKMQEMQGRGMI